MEIQVFVLGDRPRRLRFHTTTSSLPSHHPALSSPCPKWAGGGSPTFPQQEANEAQLVHLPRHILVELVNDGGGVVVVGRGTRRLFIPGVAEAAGGCARQL